jgi:uncharacterized Zn-finger protein
MNRLVLALFIALSCAAFAQDVPSQLSFSARISNAGVPLTGNHTVLLKLYGTPSGGAELWSESSTANAEGGLVTLVLGVTTALGPSILDGRPLFVEVSVDGQVLLPRLPVVSVPYAVRASVAASAGTLGSLTPADLALVNHTHPGVYLPVSASNTCPGTEKMIGLNASGSVVCSADLNTGVSFAGTGSATTASRSDHSHPNIYLPVGPTLGCAATQKVSGLSSNGSVICTADIDTNTTYSPSASISLANNTVSVTYAGSGIGFGTASTPARSDHPHLYNCPQGYEDHFFGNGTPEGTRVLCSKAVASAAITWSAAQRSCAQNHSSGMLCTMQELVTARISGFSSVPQPLFANYWMGDRVGDNLALYSNFTTGDDFDGAADTSTTTMVGYYCCTSGNFFR